MIEEEKERLGKSINNKYKSNRKITELQNIDIDNIVKELIISDNPENKEIYQKMIIITKSFLR